MALELTLEPVPSAARTARDWVKQELAERASSPELADAAVLGVSELVTNAVLHVRSTIVVRIVEDDNRLRVEVYDDSPRPPQGHPVYVPDGRHIPSTIGRGLQIVDSISHSWGISYEHIGKCIWFLPAPVERGSLPVPDDWPWTGDEDTDAGATDADATDDVAKVRLVDLPLHLDVHYRDRFFDLHREMTLIALDDRHGSDLAERLVDVAAPLQAFHLDAHGIQEQIETALSKGFDRVDVAASVPRSLAPLFLELGILIDRANEFCADEKLLTLAAGPQEQAFRAWYLGELADQLRGRDPRPWTGAFVVTDPDPEV